MQFVQTLSSVVHAGKGRKPRLRRVRPTSNNSAILLLLKFFLCRRKHQLNTVQLVYLRSTRIIIDSHDIGIRMIMSDSLYNSLTEYSCAITPQVRQAGNRLSGLTETAYASLLA